MKKTLSTDQVARELLADDNAGWSRAGAFALAEYLEQLEEGTGEDMELDVVALRCEFAEYESAIGAACEYGYKEQLQAVMDSNEDDTIEGASEADALSWLEERTTVIPFNGGVIIQQF